MNDDVSAMQEYLEYHTLPRSLYYGENAFGSPIQMCCRLGATNIFFYLNSTYRYHLLANKKENFYGAII